jgi:hypothetical protein
MGLIVALSFASYFIARHFDPQDHTGAHARSRRR